MKCAILLGVIALITTLAIEDSLATGTSKPFVRSRYSKRWRIPVTTEPNAANGTLTTEQQKTLETEVTTVETVRVNNQTVVKPEGTTAVPSLRTTIYSKDVKDAKKDYHSTTTEHPRHAGPNGLPLDYDYYGNGGENEDEGGHK
ncbi:uncharacterized protein LOC105664596 [Ceratitis capitata]|nr:uncharacterized protein LOC105664596 [Ceratitis capitata]